MGPVVTDEPCDGRRTPIAIHCYACHTTVSMLRCGDQERGHRGHAQADEERGWAEHSTTCEPNLLAPDGSIPLTAHPCGCVTRDPQCRHHASAVAS